VLAAVSAAREFMKFLEGFRRRLERERRPPTEDERAELFAFWDAVEREHEATPPHVSTGGMSVWRGSLPTTRQALEAEFGAAEPRLSGHGDARRTPAPIAMELIEEAVRIHEREGFGRRRLETAVPRLTDYTAGQILRWYRVGAPAGLWLDDKHRLKWGPAISPTPTGLRLPRL
jgi:hypothetical protein